MFSVGTEIIYLNTGIVRHPWIHASLQYYTDAIEITDIFYLCPSLLAKVGGRPGFPKCLARVSTADPVSLCVSQSLDLE